MNRCIARQSIAACLLLCFVHVAFGIEPSSNDESSWLPLARDDLHDPQNLALRLLQNPAKALSLLPHDGSGDQVNWVQAIESNFIKPRISLHSGTQPEILDLNILFSNTGEMDQVEFPHKQHTEWLVCSNCHEEIFKYKAHATKFGMFNILNGEYCGRCHGAVAFPLTECKRCHNMPRTPSTRPAKAN